MDLGVQLFTGSAMTSECMDADTINAKLNRIYYRKDIVSAYIGWNKDVDINSIADRLKREGTEIYFWLPVFSELSQLADFEPLIGIDGKKIGKIYDSGSDELFMFCCPANPKNTDIAIDIYERYYDNEIYDGIFLDKIRFPSFIGGLATVKSCYCEYCRSNFDLPSVEELTVKSTENPLGITTYNDLRYEMSPGFKKLFEYKSLAVFNSLERLCIYFKSKGLKISLDLFAPFMSVFTGQDYHRLLKLTDVVKPMLYKATNAPAGLPFEVHSYSRAFDNVDENAQRRSEHLKKIVSYNSTLISNEVKNIKRIISEKGLDVKLHAGIEINYIENIAPVTKKYIKESVASVNDADGIIASWNLNTMPDENIDCLLNEIGA